MKLAPFSKPTGQSIMMIAWFLAEVAKTEHLLILSHSSSVEINLIEANGVHYHVEVEGSGAPLVLLHGFTGRSENWTKIRAALNDHFTTITIDLVGHGQTDSPTHALRYSMEHAADDLAVIVTKLEFPSVNMLGYSMGGRLALFTAITHPTLIHTLMLESASPGLESEAERVKRIQSDDQLADKIEAEGLETFVDYWTNLALFETQSDELKQALKAQRLKSNPLGLANSLRGMGTGVQSPLWHRLNELTCPTLLLTGELDKKFTSIAHSMAAQISRVQTKTIPGAGHAVHLEQPEAYTQAVLGFLALYH
jgi:2-succinyl-6-hydroxy-2,4-cyclohexadiene-1-carboxylate synthase